MFTQRGFTLVEMMVTVVIVAVLTMVAAPSFLNLLASQNLETSARDLAQVFGNARAQAVALRKNVTLKFEQGVNDSTTFYWVPKSGNGAALTSDNVDVVFGPTGLAKQRTIMIDNVNYNPANPTDMTTTPPTNPPKVPQIVPMEFVLCNTKLKQTRIVSISSIGTINKIRTGTCA